MSVYSGDKQALYTEARRLEAENARLRTAGDDLARAVRGLDSYAALGGAPMERTDSADAALAAWRRLAFDEDRA